MKATFRSSFLRDLKKLKDRNVRQQVREVIVQVEAAADVRAIGNLSKMSGGGSFYKIRIGEYRIGLSIKGNVVEFVRCLPRRDIYRYFP